jgi:hypothetical protein
MTIEEDDDDRPRRDITELMPIALAFILTVAAVGLIFFKFTVGGPKPAAEPTEVTIGIGQGQTIHPAPAKPNP